MMRIARTYVVRYTQQINKISIMMTILFVINSVEAEYGHGSRLRNKMPIKNKRQRKNTTTTAASPTTITRMCAIDTEMID